MKKIGKIKPIATIVAQFAAGVEVEAISHEGKVFLPVMNLSALVSGDDDVEDTPAPSAGEDKPTPTTTKKGKTDKKSAAPVNDEGEDAYTEKELMDMPTKELIKILKDEFGIDPNEYDGKNTNKKLRDLILDAQEKGGAGDGDENNGDDGENGDENGDDEGSVADKVAELLEAYDAGEKNKKSVIAAIKKLSTEDYEEADVLDLIQEFDDNTEADIDEIAEKIARVLEGKKATKSKKAPKKSKKGDDEDDLVEVSDLKVGDRVSVWWDDDNQDWFDGEVKSIKRGKVTIAYDDDTEDVIDPEVHTKIKLIED